MKRDAASWAKYMREYRAVRKLLGRRVPGGKDYRQARKRAEVSR